MVHICGLISLTSIHPPFALYQQPSSPPRISLSHAQATWVGGIYSILSPGGHGVRLANHSTAFSQRQVHEPTGANRIRASILVQTAGRGKVSFLLTLAVMLLTWG